MVICSKYSMEKGGVSGGRGSVGKKKGGEKPRKRDQLNFNLKKKKKNGKGRGKENNIWQRRKNAVKTNIRND